MGDEEWLVSKAKSCLKTDIYAAKAWLITARTLYPRNFSLQFEAYSIEKSYKNVRHAAKTLEEMLVQFPGEQILWQEIQTMIDALQADNKEERTQFLTDVFTALPSSLQSHMLLRVADTCQDNMLQLRLMLLVLTRHGDHVAEHGVKLIEKLLNNEKHHQMTSPINCYRKYLVCDVLPLVLKSDLPQVQSKQLIRWLQKSIEFFVCFVSQPPQAKSDTPLSPGPELGSPKFPGFSGPTNKWRVSIPGLSDRESVVEKPLHRLADILSLVGRHLGWGDSSDFSNQTSEVQWQRILELNQCAKGEGVKQVLYSAAIVFFTSVFHYACGMTPSEFAATTNSSPAANAVLIEGIQLANSPDGRSAGIRSDAVQLSASKKLLNAKELSSHFTLALNCWRFLQETDHLQKEFVKLLQHWKADNWMWLKSFEADVLIYQGQFKDACAKLLAMKSIRQKQTILPVDLQLACCYYAQGNYSRTCETLLSMIHGLSVAGGLDGAGEQVPVDARPVPAGARQLQFILCNEAEVMPYVIHLMITCFKEKALKPYPASDACMGHLLVLLQYDWPRYHSVFREVMDKIIRQESLTYTQFFNYVINIDILEEFAYLKTGAAGKIVLDILPVSAKQIAQFRTVTRGVNKGVKEDFKVHLDKQVLRSHESIDHVLRTFLSEEKDDLQQSLS